MNQTERALGLISSIVTILGFLVALSASNSALGLGFTVDSFSTDNSNSYTLTVFLILLTGIVAGFIFSMAINFARESIGSSAVFSLHPLIGFISGFQTSFITHLIFGDWATSYWSVAIFVFFCLVGMFFEITFIVRKLSSEGISEAQCLLVAVPTAVFFCIAVVAYAFDVVGFDQYLRTALIVVATAIFGFFFFLFSFAAGEGLDN